jgi:hypothetical protein
MSELDDLMAQTKRLGVASHVHGRAADEPCPLGELCIREAEPFSALVKSPDRAEAVDVDVMTAFGVLSILPDDAGLDPTWAELQDIDRGV